MADSRQTAYAERLARLIRMETISAQGQTDKTKFYAFQEELRAVTDFRMCCIRRIPCCSSA